MALRVLTCIVASHSSSSQMEHGLCGEGKEGKNSGDSEVGEHLDKCKLCNGHQIRLSGDEIVKRRMKSIYI